MPFSNVVYFAGGGATRKVRRCSALKPGSTSCRRAKLLINRPAATRSTSESATSATINVFPILWRAADVLVRPPSFNVSPTSVRDAFSAGAVPKSTPVRTETIAVNAHDTPVERDLGEPWNVGRRERDEQFDAPDSREQPQPRRRRREQHALGEQLTHDSRAPRAERGSNRDLLAARRRAREQEVRDVRAADEENATDRGELKEQEPARAAHDLFLQAAHGRVVPAPIGVGMFHHHLTGDGVHPGLSLGD